MDLKKISEFIKEVLNSIFKGKAPDWLVVIVNIIFLIAILLIGLLALLYSIVKIKEHIEKIRNLKKIEDRQKIANCILEKVKLMVDQERWINFKYTELEAEVEGKGRFLFSKFSIFNSKNTLKREASLSKALKYNKERLIILEGVPGSGKSVVLKELTIKMASKALHQKSLKSIIPIYVNLKNLEKPPDVENIDSSFIKSFILKSIGSAVDNPAELEKIFDDGLWKGTWLFLFDSFDEIPEVLSSTEVDRITKRYSDAIREFCRSGKNKCRCIIASREFRGPGRFGGIRFKILPLSEERRIKFIGNTDINPDLKKLLIGSLRLSHEDIYEKAKNPMFLSLLCEYVRDKKKLRKTENVHGIYESYINNRISNYYDEYFLKGEFEIPVERLRDTAQKVAFCMTINDKLGLRASIEDLKRTMLNQKFEAKDDFEEILEVLISIKLARFEIEPSPGGEKYFTFYHRYFQEYFSTCVVLENPDIIDSNRLLTDARWREITVTLLQTKPIKDLMPLFDETRNLLTQSLDTINRELDNLEEVQNNCYSSDTDDNEDDSSKVDKPIVFPWPSFTLHLLSILHSGSGGRLQEWPDDIREICDNIISIALERGIRIDKKWAIDVSGIVPDSALLEVLRKMYGNPSQWLKDAAYQQLSRLRKIPADIALWIREELLLLYLQKKLRSNKDSTYVFIDRLANPELFIRVLKVLLHLRFIDFSLHLALLIIIKLHLVEYYGSWKPNDFILLFLIPFLFAFRFKNSDLNISLFWWPLLRYTAMIFIVSCLDIELLIETIYVIGQSKGTPNVSILFWEYYGYLPWLMIYVVAWAPGAQYFAIEGKFLRPICWFFFPISPLFKFISFISDRSEKLYRNVKRIRISKTSLISFLQTAIAVVISVAFGFLVHYLNETVAFNRFLKYSWDIFSIFFLTILAAGLLGIGIIFISDSIRVVRFVRNQYKLTHESFIKIFTKLYTDVFLMWFIRFVRQNALLKLTEKSKEVIERLAIAMECKKVRVDDLTWIAEYHRQGKYFKIWLWFKKNMFSFSSESLDEMSKLLGQVRLKLRE